MVLVLWVIHLFHKSTCYPPVGSTKVPASEETLAISTSLRSNLLKRSQGLESPRAQELAVDRKGIPPSKQSRLQTPDKIYLWILTCYDCHW